MLTHRKIALEKICGFSLTVLLGNKEFYRFWTNESSNYFQSYHVMILESQWL